MALNLWWIQLLTAHDLSRNDKVCVRLTVRVIFPVTKTFLLVMSFKFINLQHIGTNKS